MKKGDLCKFIGRSVQKEVFAQTLPHVQANVGGRDRVGGGVTPAVLPRHRARGSASSGSLNTPEPSQRIEQPHQTQMIEKGLREGCVSIARGEHATAED